MVARAHEARRRPTGTGDRRHNPAIARYLGLESRDEPLSLEKYAPLAPYQGPRTTSTKRRSQAIGSSNSDRTPVNTSERTFPTQQLIAQSFRVAKSSREIDFTKPQRHVHRSPASTISQTNFQTSPHQSTPYRGTNQSQCSNQTNQTDTDSLQNSPARQEAVDTFLSEDDFDDGVMDDDLLSVIHAPSSLVFDDPFEIKSIEGGAAAQRQAEVDVTSSKSLVLEARVSSESSQCSRKKFRSPLTQTSQLLAATGDVENPNARKPIVRPSFPAVVRDRSPIIGLSSNTLLRTCFRIGEVVNQSHQTLRSGQNVIFELYARVLESDRTEIQQTFTFCDLFHARPPYLKGIYHATIWKSVQLFEYDSRRLLHKGRICRSIGTTKRVNKQWVMTVLNIWEATWEDIKWVEGIVSF